MSKNKRQLRAEVVERLREINSYSTVGDILCAVCGKPDYRTWDATQDRDALIKLLTDDDANDDLPPENDVSAKAVDANDGNAIQDSREKLEAEIYATSSDEWANMSYSRVLEWLDRQAAITERECREYEEAMREQHYKRIAELRAEFDRLRNELERANERNGVQGSRIMALEAGEPTSECRACFDAMQRERYSIKLERDNANAKKHDLGRQVSELAAERDELEAKLARMHAIISKALDEIASLKGPQK